jgi:predicted aconitase
MRLSDEEQAMLAGDQGPGVRRAMESVQVSGVSYKNLGDAGLQFLQTWAAEGAQIRVSTTLNPAGMDLQAWQELGFSPAFAHRQQAVVRAYEDLGVTATCTCTPYDVGCEPALGQHIAWAESSAVSYANSVLGARTNREGGPSALAAAITGRTARYGLHLEEARRAYVRVRVTCKLGSQADYAALGFLVGRQVGQAVPLLELPVTCAPRATDLKALGAAMAASGAVALYHIQGVTPEAVREDMLAPGAASLLVDDLAPAYTALNGPVNKIDLVSIGCPHASLGDIHQVADLVSGKQLRSALWLTTSRMIREAADREGLTARIEAAGGRVVADTCLVVAPAAELGFRTMATNSAKMAWYAPSHSNLVVRFGTMEQCVEAAVKGRWE